MISYSKHSVILVILNFSCLHRLPTQLGPQWVLWVEKPNPRPIVGYEIGPKTQTICGLGWVGFWVLWVLSKPSNEHRHFGYLSSTQRKGQILESPNFPAPALPKGVSTKRRDVCYLALRSFVRFTYSTEALLECDFTNGIAYVGPTAENIKHLQIEQKKMCVAEPNHCARVSYLDQSGLFFCNYV